MTSRSDPNRPPTRATGHSSPPPRRIRNTASVWALPEHPHRENSSPVPSWLGEAVRRVATTYSRPGDHVLLLASPTLDGSDAGRCDDAAFDSWTDTAQLLTQFGRPTHVRTLASLTSPADPATSESATESGPRPAARTLLESTLHHRPGQTDHHPAPSGTPAAARPGPDRYPLVITRLDPQSDWAATVPWTRLLTRNGTLVFITHGDMTRDRHGRTHHLLTHISEWGGVDCVDRIALVAAPDETHPAAAEQPSTGRRAHTEFVVFARPRPTGSRGVGQAVAR